ncbi:MAG: (2Fe-2S) ferredoxin domain-containing protein [Desulfobacteria bacterium]|jgi:(2Fe-2S) ferredoxin
MEKPKHHIFVCCSFRGREIKGKCIKKNSIDLIPYIVEEVADRGMNAMVSSAGCFNRCDDGPVVVIYPQGYWYGGVEGEDQVDEILDALEEGRSEEKYLIA